MKKSIREKQTKKKYSGEASPYWENVGIGSASVGGSPGELREPAQANPDVLGEDDHIFHRPLSEYDEFKFNAVRKIISSLSKQQQRVLQLCGFEGMTLREAGEELGISPGTVAEFLRRARATIKRKFAELEKNSDRVS